MLILIILFVTALSASTLNLDQKRMLLEGPPEDYAVYNKRLTLAWHTVKREYLDGDTPFHQVPSRLWTLAFPPEQISDKDLQPHSIHLSEATKGYLDTVVNEVGPPIYPWVHSDHGLPAVLSFLAEQLRLSVQLSQQVSIAHYLLTQYAHKYDEDPDYPGYPILEDLIEKLFPQRFPEILALAMPPQPTLKPAYGDLEPLSSDDLTLSHCLNSPNKVPHSLLQPLCCPAELLYVRTTPCELSSVPTRPHCKGSGASP